RRDPLTAFNPAPPSRPSYNWVGGTARFSYRIAGTARSSVGGAGGKAASRDPAVIHEKRHATGTPLAAGRQAVPPLLRLGGWHGPVFVPDGRHGPFFRRRGG